MSVSIGFVTTGSTVTHLAEKTSKHAEPGVTFSFYLPFLNLKCLNNILQNRVKSYLH